MASAAQFKDQGNKAFQAGDYKEAEVLYTRAIQRDPSNAVFFTNRAFARVKLELWEGCLDDSLKAIELQSNNLKGYYYLAMAQLRLKHPNEAVNSALTAYEIGVQTGSASTRNAASLVLEAKKAKWEAKERERLRQHSDLLRELEDSLKQSGARQAEETDDPMEVSEINDATRRKIEELYTIFAIADPTHMQRREVPDYMIDNISFAFMHDPVVTKSGQSYERSTIEAHLKISQTDPLTREPLKKEELRPNLALKQACAEFLENNGWAVDW